MLGAKSRYWCTCERLTVLVLSFCRELHSRCLLLWRHVDTSSDLVFNKEPRSAMIMHIFSLRHNWHFPTLLEYGAALLQMDHSILNAERKTVLHTCSDKTALAQELKPGQNFSHLLPPVHICSHPFTPVHTSFKGF